MKNKQKIQENPTLNFSFEVNQEPNKTYCPCGSELGDFEIQEERCLECEKTHRKNNY